MTLDRQRLRIALSAGALCAIGLIATLPVAALGQADPSPIPSGYKLGPVVLPPPGGHHPVGLRRFELARADGTPLAVIAWYPAAAADGARAPYFSDTERQVTAPALSRNFRWPETMLASFAEMRTNAYQDAPIARGRYPLVIFSHGYTMYPQQNAALMEHLAAAGYVILSVAHPGDAADLPSSRGTLPTRYGEVASDPDPGASDAFWAAPDRRTQLERAPALWRAPRFRYMADRLEIWRQDLKIVSDAMAAPHPPSEVRAIAAAVRGKPLAYAGMSFGGSTSISICVRDPRCRAAINIDGIEFDSGLYDRDAGKPILLIQSDWRVYPNAGPPGRAFTAYDLAYERRATAGRNADIHRFRLDGIRHLGLSDLILAPRDPHRDALLGTIDGARATAALNAISLAFLDHYLAGRRVSLSTAVAEHPELVRHSAGETYPR